MMDCIPNMRGFDDMDAPTTRAYVDGQHFIPQGIQGVPYRFVARLDADGEIVARTYRGPQEIGAFLEAYVAGRCDYSEREIADGHGARAGEPVTLFRVVDGEEIPWFRYTPDANHPAGVVRETTPENMAWDRERAKRAARRRAEIEERIGGAIRGRYGGTLRPGDVTAEIREALREAREERSDAN